MKRIITSNNWCEESERNVEMKRIYLHMLNCRMAIVNSDNFIIPEQYHHKEQYGERDNNSEISKKIRDRTSSLYDSKKELAKYIGKRNFML